jgi:WD40 repeat protein
MRTLLFPAALTCCTLDPCDWALYAGAMDGRIFTAPLAGGEDSAGPTGDSAQQLVAHTRPVRCVVATADGEHLLSCGDDGIAVVWCTSSRQPLRCLEPARGNSQYGESVGAPPEDAHDVHLVVQLQQARDEAARWKALHGQMRALVAEEQTR